MNRPLSPSSYIYQYPEIAVCMEDTGESEYGKFYIPVVTPFLDNNVPYDKKDDHFSRSNIINQSDIGSYLETCTVSNYIELKLPNKEIGKKGDKFVVIFIGGDVNKPCLIGRYN